MRDRQAMQRSEGFSARLGLIGVGGAPERSFLLLDATKATRLLDWHQEMDFAATIASTVEWYYAQYRSPGFDGALVATEQIERYLDLDAGGTVPSFPAVAALIPAM